MTSSPFDYTDLEIRVFERQAAGYPVEITVPGQQEFPRGYLNPSILPWMPTLNAPADGENLFRRLFADAAVQRAWAEARGRWTQRRVRLRIDREAAELHAIPWELLRDPGDGDPSQALDMAASAATPFSRYLAGRWLPSNPILQRPVRMLVAIADPLGLEQYNLAPIRADEEWAALNQALAGLDVQLTRLPSPCTLGAIEDELRKGYHILHFIGHGSYREDMREAALYLAGDGNQVCRVMDAEVREMFARRLADTDVDQDSRLRLVFLASCQTATRSPADAFRGLAPQLVAAGVPAVVAMQDLVPVDTAREFAMVFYRELLQHGQADLAANEARSAVITARLPGAAIPVLFMRLRNGQLLGQRGQILGDRAASFWTVLLGKIAAGKCTPILGSGVTSGLLPSPVDLARQLAVKYNYPFPTTQSLPRVAQFVASIDDEELRAEVFHLLIAGFRDQMGIKSPAVHGEEDLCEVIVAADWATRSLELFESEIHAQLAELNLPIYLTTNTDNFMSLALQARLGHPCRRQTVNWREVLSPGAARPHYDLSPPASPSDPMVLHLFGSDCDPHSMVLTEDDYLDYLARISRDYEYLLPTSVNAALASTTLLLLGYQLEDLELKVILRGLLANLDLRRWRVLRVAVQIESEAVDRVKLEEVTGYFQRYFRESEIDVYWGSTRQFVAELHTRWQEYRRG